MLPVLGAAAVDDLAGDAVVDDLAGAAVTDLGGGPSMVCILPTCTTRGAEKEMAPAAGGAVANENEVAGAVVDEVGCSSPLGNIRW